MKKSCYYQPSECADITGLFYPIASERSRTAAHASGGHRSIHWATDASRLLVGKFNFVQLTTFFILAQFCINVKWQINL